MKKVNILVVDDDSSMLSTMRFILNSKYRVHLAQSGREASAIVRSKQIHLVFLDIMLPDTDGMQLLKQIKASYPDIEVVMVTAVNDVKRAVEAIKSGAFHYITKDFSADEILLLVDKVCEKIRQEREIASLRSEVEDINNKEMILGGSRESRRVNELIAKVADLPTNILIEGESGTGKELLARAIHRKSRLRGSPFVTLHVASLPNNLVESALFGHERGAFTGATQQRIGKFEMADGGTLLLDEVSEINPDIQVKLLRFLQEGEIERVGSSRTVRVNVRLIAATNRNLRELVKQGRFRQDLYYRLNVVPIHLPALRERREDIEELVPLFLRRYCRRFGKKEMCFTPEALKVLKDYHWPGNIRELEHLIERLVAISDSNVLSEEDIPLEYSLVHSDTVDHSIDLDDKDEEGYLRLATAIFERKLIGKALLKSGGNRRKTAAQLGIPLSTLKFKMQKLGINGNARQENTIQ